MAGRTWYLEGKWLEYCSCDHGCPCEAMAPPTQGHCEGVVAFKIDEGYCEDVRLDDLVVVAPSSSPAPCTTAAAICSRSWRRKRPRRSARRCSTSSRARISRSARCSRSSASSSSICTTRSSPPSTSSGTSPAAAPVSTYPASCGHAANHPVTDEEHRMVTVLPDGWVFREAENAAGYAKGLGDLKFDLSDRHSSLAYFAWNQDGMALDLGQTRAQFPLA